MHEKYVEGIEGLTEDSREIIVIMAEELWFKIHNSPMPSTFSIRDKLNFYKENHINFLQSLAKNNKSPIIYHNYYYIDHIKREIINLPEELWFTDTSRQKSYIVHRQTQSLINTDISILYKKNDPFVVKEHGILPIKIKEQISDIICDLQRRFNGRVAKSNIVRLDAGCFIPEHSDNFEYLRMVHRFHIPILTNPDVIFKVGEESINMKEGECFEIDVSLLHSVWNNGSTPRIHLIIDIMPNEFIK